MKWTHIIVLSGWFLSIVTCMSVLIVALGTLAKTGHVPEQLFGWANLVLGFLLSKVYDLVNNYVDITAKSNGASKATGEDSR